MYKLYKESGDRIGTAYRQRWFVIIIIELLVLIGCGALAVAAFAQNSNVNTQPDTLGGTAPPPPDSAEVYGTKRGDAVHRDIPVNPGFVYTEPQEPAPPATVNAPQR